MGLGIADSTLEMPRFKPPKLVSLLFFIHLFFLMPNRAQGIPHEQLVHLTAHVGASYALQTVFYGVSSRYLGLDFLKSELLAAGGTLGVGLLYKFTSDSRAGAIWKATYQNSIGVGLAIGTHLVFKF